MSVHLYEIKHCTAKIKVLFTKVNLEILPQNRKFVCVTAIEEREHKLHRKGERSKDDFMVCQAKCYHAEDVRWSVRVNLPQQTFYTTSKANSLRIANQEHTYSHKLAGSMY